MSQTFLLLVLSAAVVSVAPVVVQQVLGQDVEHDKAEQREENKVRGLERHDVLRGRSGLCHLLFFFLEDVSIKKKMRNFDFFIRTRRRRVQIYFYKGVARWKKYQSGGKNTIIAEYKKDFQCLVLFVEVRGVGGGGDEKFFCCFVFRVFYYY